MPKPRIVGTIVRLAVFALVAPATVPGCCGSGGEGTDVGQDVAADADGDGRADRAEADGDVPATCGNGEVEPGEECDDGNTVDTDDCTSSCRRAACGDGFVRAGHETCDGAEPRPCVAECGTSGTQACTDCSWAATCAPPAETCNGSDDDCDTVIDDDLPCLPGDAVACTTSCGSTGTGVCTAACELPTGAACDLPAEECNGLDDDCDGVIDDGFACVQGSPVACTTTCHSAGTGVCTAACELPSGGDCLPWAETCNGADDDCDGVVDSGFACIAGAIRPCAIAGCVGMQTCAVADCTWGWCDIGGPPANDACGGTLPDISAGGVFVGTTCAGTDDWADTCGGGSPAASPDVVFRLELPTRSDVVIDTVGTAFDALLFIRHDGSCPGTTADACDDDGAGGTPGQASIAWPIMPAGTYWVILDGAGSGSQGTYVLNVSITPHYEPLNDTCAGAAALDASGTYSGSTATAFDDHAPSCGTGAGPDIWYTFTLAGRELVYLDVVDGGAWNTVLDVVQGACPAPGTPVGCNDDACGGNRSQWFGPLDAGTYYVVVDGVGATDRGDYTLLYQHAPCADATFVAANGTYTGTTVGAPDSHPDEGCGGDLAGDVVYYFALCAARPVTATTCSFATRFDTALYFAEADCRAAMLDCNDDGSCLFPAVASRLTATLAKGLDFLTVDGDGGGTGPYGLTITGL